MTEKIQTNLSQNVSLTVQCGRKILLNLTGKGIVDCLPVLVLGSEVGKLFRVQKLESSTTQKKFTLSGLLTPYLKFSFQSSSDIALFKRFQDKFGSINH